MSVTLTIAGDGCSPECAPEPGWACADGSTVAPSRCRLGAAETAVCEPGMTGARCAEFCTGRISVSGSGAGECGGSGAAATFEGCVDISGAAGGEFFPREAQGSGVRVPPEAFLGVRELCLRRFDVAPDVGAVGGAGLGAVVQVRPALALAVDVEVVLDHREPGLGGNL